MSNNEAEKHEPKKKEEKPVYATLDQVKYCTRCGKMAMAQRPQDVGNGAVYCSACGAKFRVEPLGYN